MNRIRPVIVALILVVIPALIYLNRNLLNSQRPPVPTGTSPSSGTTTQPAKISGGEIPDIPFVLPSGYTIRVFAKDLGTARDLEYSPGGTLLVSSPSEGTVYALPDKNKDGIADSNKVVISGENHPHGLAFYQGKLFLADIDKVVRFSWDETTLKATQDKILFSLPQNNDHNNRTITFDNSGKMYVSVGSTCNVCNEASNLSATVVISDADGNNPTVFAKGLRNAAFIQFNPSTKELWGTEMGRDSLGDNLPPDEINIIRQGKDYGWPNCYGNKILDTTFNPNASCGSTEAPIYGIPAHSAPLGFVFINSPQFPGSWQGDLLVAYHGSWNRSTPVGYKVVHLKIVGNTITASDDFLTGFLPGDATSGNEALGRPVDLIFDSAGNLYLSDDKTGTVYIIQKEEMSGKRD